VKRLHVTQPTFCPPTPNQTPHKQLAKGPVAVGTLMQAGGGIKIADGGDSSNPAAPTDDLMTADEEMARRLQAQMDAQAYGAGGGGNRGRNNSTAAAAAYIKISEEEIADDYPLPKQYNKVGGCIVFWGGEGEGDEGFADGGSLRECDT